VGNSTPDESTWRIIKEAQVLGGLAIHGATTGGEPMNRTEEFRIPIAGKSQPMLMAEIDALIKARLDMLEEGMCLHNTINLSDIHTTGDVIVSFDIKPKS